MSIDSSVPLDTGDHFRSQVLDNVQSMPESEIDNNCLGTDPSVQAEVTPAVDAFSKASKERKSNIQEIERRNSTAAPVAERPLESNEISIIDKPAGTSLGADKSMGRPK